MTSQIRTAILDDIDHLAGEWNSVSNLLLAAATVSYARASAANSNTDKRHADACVRVAQRLSELRD